MNDKDVRSMPIQG